MVNMILSEINSINKRLHENRMVVLIVFTIIILYLAITSSNIKRTLSNFYIQMIIIFYIIFIFSCNIQLSLISSINTKFERSVPARPSPSFSGGL